MNFFKIIGYYFTGGKKPPKDERVEVNYDPGKVQEEDKKKKGAPKDRYDTNMDDSFDLPESSIYMKKDDFFSMPGADSVKIFNYKWWEWTVIGVEICIVLYAILIFSKLVPLF